jgi:hypothetical protein
MTAHLDCCRVDFVAAFCVPIRACACKQAGGQHRVCMPAPLSSVIELEPCCCQHAGACAGEAAGGGERAAADAGAAGAAQAGGPAASQREPPAAGHGGHLGSARAPAGGSQRAARQRRWVQPPVCLSTSGTGVALCGVSGPCVMSMQPCTGDDAARAVAAGAGGGFSGAMHAAAETAFLNSVFTEAGPDPTAAQVGVTAANVNTHTDLTIQPSPSKRLTSRSSQWLSLL